MTLAASERRPAAETIRVSLPSRPRWLSALAWSDPSELATTDPKVVLDVATTDSLSLFQAIVPSAGELDDESFLDAVRSIYLEIDRALAETGRFVWRYWNHVPALGASAEIAANRYQIFNVGRYEALAPWAGGDFASRLAASTAVGHRGADLVIDVLAGSEPGVPMENHRQSPSWCYTSRWGPRPPCFARAVVVPSLAGNTGAERCVLVSGTASVVGEDSLHPGDLEAQIEETLRNLAALVPSAPRASRSPFAALARYRELRLYVAHERNLEAAADTLSRRFPELERLEVGVADLCRDELLLEVEALATADG